jgi:hypothetical protein
LNDVKNLLLYQPGFFADTNDKVTFGKSHSYRLFCLLTKHI